MAEWRMIPDAPTYSVSDEGAVRGARGGILKGGTLPDGRRWVWLGRGNRQYVHHVVAEAFHGPRPDGMECCHNNGDNTDNRASNLRWDTPKANQHDKIAHGTTNRGSRHGLSKLHECEVREIKRALKAGVPQKYLAAVFRVDQSQICAINTGKQWGWLAA